MRIILFYFLVFFQFSLGAKDIETSYKKALHKFDDCRISGIDYIYVINEKKDLNKFRALKKKFAKYDIFPYRFNAQNPSKMTYNQLFNVGMRPTRSHFLPGLQLKRSGKNWILAHDLIIDIRCAYFNPEIKLEEISRNVDFLSVIFDAYKSKYKTVWIMQDDVKILYNPNILSAYVAKMDKDSPRWHVLYTDFISKRESDADFRDFSYPLRCDINFAFAKTYEQRETNKSPVSRLGLRRGGTSFIINKKA
jgi:hypothetical protein